jgi:hypothetical protein
MYHVDVRKVRTKTKSSVLPAISHFSGVYLQKSVFGSALRHEELTGAKIA